MATPTFGQRLRMIRERRGLTQADLAAQVGRSRQTICHFETGRSSDIRNSDLHKLAEVLGCRVRDLFAPIDAPIPPRASPRRISRRRRPACAVSASGEAAENERLKALLLEVLRRLARYEPAAVDLLDQLTAPPGSVSDVRRAA
jgi:transcriptional regulator with XRE-family HTH domain